MEKIDADLENTPDEYDDVLDTAFFSTIHQWVPPEEEETFDDIRESEFRSISEL